jgi:hypothetical protein
VHLRYALKGPAHENSCVNATLPSRRHRHLGLDPLNQPRSRSTQPILPSRQTTRTRLRVTLHTQDHSVPPRGQAELSDHQPSWVSLPMNLCKAKSYGK